MGYLDDVRLLVGRGMSAADIKTQELRIQADLSRLSAAEEKGFSELGRAVYQHPTLGKEAQQLCAEPFGKVIQLLKQESELRAQLETLQKAKATAATAPRRSATRLTCPVCGKAVTLDMRYCPECADNLANVKRNYRICPSCGTYHTTEAVFCSECGSRTTEIPVAPSVLRESTVDGQRLGAEDVLQSEMQIPEPVIPVGETIVEDFGAEEVEPTESVFAGDSAMLPEIAQDTPAVAGARHCPHCGTTTEPDWEYCRECGHRL